MEINTWVVEREDGREGERERERERNREGEKERNREGEKERNREGEKERNREKRDPTKDKNNTYNRACHIELQTCLGWHGNLHLSPECRYQ